MSARTGPFKTLRAAATFAANDTWYACTDTIQMNGGANSLRLYVTVATASAGNVEFYLQVSPDGGTTYFDLCGAGDAPEVFGPLAFTGAATKSIELSGANIPPLEYVKVYFRASAGAASATVAIQALAFESSASPVDISTGDIEIATEAIVVDTAALDTLVHAEDAAHTDADAGVMPLAVRNDTLAALAGTDGDYAPLQVNASGAVYAEIATLPGGLVGYAEDAAHGDGDIGIQMLTVRKNTPEATSGTDGDYQPALTDEHGCMHVNPQLSAVIDACNATTGWSVLSDDTDNLTTSTNHTYGTASLSFDKVDGAGNTVFAGIQKTISSVDLDKYIEHSRGFFMGSMYLSSTADVAYAWFRAGTDSSNYNEWRVDDDNLNAGEWMALRGNLGSPHSSTGNGWNSAAVTWIAIGVAFDAQDDTLANILVDGILVNAGLQVTADISTTAQINTPNVNVHRIAGTPTTSGAGAVGGGTQRITLASDDPAVTLLGTIDTDTGVIAGDTTSLDAKVPALGTAAMAASSPVTIASDDTLTTAIKTAVEIMDDWDDGSDHCEVVDPNRTPLVLNYTGSGALDIDTAIGAAFELSSISIHINTAPTTSENFIAKIDATDGAAYDTAFITRDFSTLSDTDVVWTLENGDMPRYFENGDEIDIDWTNTDARTWGVRIVYKLV